MKTTTFLGILVAALILTSLVYTTCRIREKPNGPSCFTLVTAKHYLLFRSR